MIIPNELINNWPVPMSWLNFIGAQFERGIFGILGGGVFFTSWIYQAYISKREGKSVVDVWFWIMRITGLVMITVHAIVIKDLVFIILNSLGCMLASYNLFLNVRKK